MNLSEWTHKHLRHGAINHIVVEHGETYQYYCSCGSSFIDPDDENANEISPEARRGSEIPGIIITPLTRHSDSRGWLSELWRADDETFITTASRPQMGYLSLTHIGRIRGPHEHLDQTDLFVFLSGEFKVVLWDKSGRKMIVMAGEQNPCSVLVPPGIVHAYQNIGPSSAFVLNFPNRLYGGWKRTEAVDEIRHEEGSEGRFVL